MHDEMVMKPGPQPSLYKSRESSEVFSQLLVGFKYLDAP